MTLKRPQYYYHAGIRQWRNIISKMSQSKDNFVTIVAVGSEQQEEGNTENINFESNSLGYVTVLTIGDTENNNKELRDVMEEVIVYRLPGERLGFGLKFEGGTKASEFVKRLFIQSCAVDSPASRVKSSWGKLTEGDEVLEIDSIPVNTMTRIDCVRCLKDSNVAIKLLVRHIYDTKSKCKTEDEPPSVISTEEKITPPPPPPVPPRKIPRKLVKHQHSIPPKEVQDNSQDTSAPREVSEPATNNIISKKLQSPRSSGRSYYSPDIPRRDRRFSDGSLGPPDAEVYVDLFLQESTQSLSESDDTGSSTISTVIDRFGSFPTTTTSSFSGSLPSTPTAMQRQLDISNITIYDEDDATVTSKSLMKILVQSKEENNNNIVNPEEGSPSCFQDAPLSYGNESTKIIVPDDHEDGSQQEEIKQATKKPPVPPRSRDSTLSNADIPKESKWTESTILPRLVDFVPKSNGVKENIENSTEIMKLFLENERLKTNFTDYENENLDAYNNGIDLYSSKWSLSSQLATIGEVEEEGGSEIGVNRPSATSAPVVIVENAEPNNESEKSQCQNGTLNNKESDGIMATLPSDSRQPPDGHEFPDFIEDSVRYTTQTYFEVSENEPPIKTFTSEYKSPTQYNTLDFSTKSKPTNLILSHAVSSSNTDLRQTMYDSTEDLKYSSLVSEPTTLHTRSQSLIDMSALSKQKNSKWNVMVEQRKKGLSKLKGLVIPEASENDVVPAVSIPEIKSQIATTFMQVPKLDNSKNTRSFPSNQNDSLKSIVIPPWPTSTSTNLPKYSPAFKRRSLQVYPTSNTRNETYDYEGNTEVIKYCDKSSSRTNKVNDDDLNPPKSLESISSPTRSDCSFDYVSKKYMREQNDTYQKSHMNKEDESDNDSAVSSSQSSYNSRFSPPPSPTRSCDLNNYKNKSEDDEKLNSQNRLLKPSSVEAINRKNILASAKCRSGKDLKIGSPVIRRKQEEEQKLEQANISYNNVAKKNPKETPIINKIETRIVEKVNTAFADLEAISKEIESNEISQPPTQILEIEKVPPLPARLPPKNTFIPITPPAILPIKNHTEETKENKISRELYSSSILSRRAKPINVKALKENFENFGSSPVPMPQRVPIYKSQAPTKSVKAEIAKTENKIIVNNEEKKKTEKAEEKAREIKNRKSLEVKEDALKNILPPLQMHHTTNTIVLNLEVLGGSLGITLAGGTDYESKDVTVHRIRYGSVAYQDGRLKKGDKIISVNGRSTSGLTHAETVDMLKEPVAEFSIVTEEAIKESVPSTISTLQRRSSSISVLSEPKSPSEERPLKKATHVISFMKDGAGLGFSIEGGKDSPLGDKPLVIKKIFTGGAADKCGELKVGDEILCVNNTSFSNLSRIESWTLMKKIPDGNVNIHIVR